MERSVNLLAIFAPLSLAAATAAVAASAACCVLPLTLAAFGVGGAWIGTLAPLAFMRPLLLTAAGLSLAAAWLVALRRIRPCGQAACALRVRGAPLVLLTLATILAGVALLWTSFEAPQVSTLVRLAAGGP